MRVINTPNAGNGKKPRKNRGLTTAAESGSEASPVPIDTNIYRKYNKLLRENLKLREELRRALSPIKSRKDAERMLSSVKRFFSGMNDAQGAVTAAGLYDTTYFAEMHDQGFRKMLLTYLLERFEKCEPLIVPTYDFWISLAEKDKEYE